MNNISHRYWTFALLIAVSIITTSCSPKKDKSTKSGSNASQHIEISDNMVFLIDGSTLTLHASNFQDFDHNKTLLKNLQENGVGHVKLKNVPEDHYFCPACFTAEQMEEIDSIYAETRHVDIRTGL